MFYLKFIDAEIQKLVLIPSTSINVYCVTNNCIAINNNNDTYRYETKHPEEVMQVLIEAISLAENGLPWRCSQKTALYLPTDQALDKTIIDLELLEKENVQ